MLNKCLDSSSVCVVIEVLCLGLACVPDTEQDAAEVLHMFLLHMVSAAAAVHKPQQRADHCRQLRCTLHFTRACGRVRRLALWWQPKCCLFQMFSHFSCKTDPLCVLFILICFGKYI